jgi:hypothetical protein
MADRNLVIHIANNVQDWYYETAESVTKEFLDKVKQDGITLAWEWLVKQDVRHDRVDMTLDSVFIDTDNVAECLKEIREGGRFNASGEKDEMQLG